jgi:hypothetical protein
LQSSRWWFSFAFFEEGFLHISVSPLALNPTGRKDVLELLRTASTTVMGSLPEMELFLADPRTTQKSLGLSQELMKALLQTDLQHPLLIQVMLKPNQYSSVL